MKRIFALTLVLVLMLGTIGVPAFATTDDGTQVYVTIADNKGQLVLTQEKIHVTDIDSDGALTVNDALYCAHQEKFEGGASAGYASSNSAYGLSLDKLWGVANGGSYGYYVNNTSAMSLADVIKNGDYINVYVYTDLTAWSDIYCFFDVNTVTAETGDEIQLALSYAGYDEAWNPVTLPVANATITLNGEKTDFKTDNEGKVTITVSKPDDYVISAVSDTQTLVPPVCMAEITGQDLTPTEPEVEQPATDITPPESVKVIIEEEPVDTDDNMTSPKTGDNKAIYMGVMVVLLFSVTLVVLIKGKKSYEK